MATNLQVDKNFTATAQSVKDQNGQTSPLTLSVDRVGIGTATPEPSTKLDVAGEIQILTGSNPTQYGGDGPPLGQIMQRSRMTLANTRPS